MNELNYLVFLLHNRLSENYSIKDLRREIENRIKELLSSKQGDICPECEYIIGVNSECFMCNMFDEIKRVENNQ